MADDLSFLRPDGFTEVPDESELRTMAREVATNAAYVFTQVKALEANLAERAVMQIAVCQALSIHRDERTAIELHSEIINAIGELRGKRLVVEHFVRQYGELAEAMGLDPKSETLHRDLIVGIRRLKLSRGGTPLGDGPLEPESIVRRHRFVADLITTTVCTKCAFPKDHQVHDVTVLVQASNTPASEPRGCVEPSRPIEHADPPQFQHIDIGPHEFVADFIPTRCIICEKTANDPVHAVPARELEHS